MIFSLIVIITMGIELQADDLWDDFIEDEPNLQRDVIIEEIQFKTGAGLRDEAFRGSLFFAAGESYARDEWQKIVALQQEFLRTVVPLYAIEIYRLPVLENTADQVVIEANPGFQWDFNFRPWDISVGNTNWLGGAEKLHLTLGLTTQEISVYSRHLAGRPFGVRTGVRRAVREDPRGFALGEMSGQLSAVQRWNPYVESELGVMGGTWWFPDAESSAMLPFTGLVLKTGLPPEWRLMPGATAAIGGALSYRWFHDFGFSVHAGVQAWAKSEPLSWLLLTYMGVWDAWLQPAPEPAYFYTEHIRSAAPMAAYPAIGQNRFQAVLNGIPAVPAGFTRITLLPFLFVDPLVELDGNLKPVKVDASVGAGAKLHFENPVNMYFGLGWSYDMSSAERQHSFLFEVISDVY